jgi:ABC-type multidrug transport system ATPase subunit
LASLPIYLTYAGPFATQEIFFPTMTVGQTIEFAAALKAPRKLPEGVTNRKAFIEGNIDFLLRSMGVAHTRDTKV